MNSLRSCRSRYVCAPVPRLALCFSTLFPLLMLAICLGVLSGKPLAAQQPRNVPASTLKKPPANSSRWVQQNWRAVPDAATEIRRMDSGTGTAAPPVLQFTGNETTFQPLGNGTYQGLLRQNGCSLSLLTASGSGTYVLDSTTPDYQDTLHKLAQLTTTPDQFTGGCTDTWPGRMAHFAALVGLTSQGYYIGAVSQLNGDETAIQTYVYNMTSQELVSSASNPTGNNTGEFVVGDVNGDGINDIVAPVGGNGTTGSVAVLLGNADGTFQPAVNYPVPFAPSGVVLQDFNGDGNLDIAVSGEDSSQNSWVGVLLGNGNGVFGTAVTSSLAANAYFLISADFNGDGKMDIAAPDGEILFGNGDGTFTEAPHRWNSGSSEYYTGMVAGDFNHDGKIDLAVLTSASLLVQIWLGNGDGTFNLNANYAAIFGGYNIGTSDLDGDGNLDLVVGTTGGGAYTLDDNTVGDFQVLMGNGDGTFRGATGFPQFGTTQNGTGGVPSFVTGDFNGDGNPDLLGTGETTASQPALSTKLGDGKGNFTQGPLSPMVVTGEFGIQTADMNGDGKLDALTLGNASSSNATPSVHVYLGNGDGSFQAGATYTLPVTPSNMAVADVNNDGKPDVVIVSTSGVYVLLNNGDGTLASAKLIDSTPTTAAVAAIADLNGDGKPDLVVLQDGNFFSSPPVPGNVLVYLGNGDGTFGAAATYLANTYSDGGLALADVNGDGKIDILATTGTYSSGGVTNSVLDVLLGNGDGTFQTPVTTTQDDQVPFLTDIAVGDFNQDGKLDVAQGDCCGLGNTYIFFGNGDGTFQAPVALGVGLSSTSLIVEDVNGDKYPDLLLASTGELLPDVLVLLNLYGANLTAQPVGTTATLTASPTTATAGTPVALTAVVKETSGSGVPTGTVTFLDGTATLGTGALDATGTAAYNATALAAGTHSLTASYGGDANNAGSTSAVVTVTINAAPTIAATSTTLTASPTSATAGTPVALTAAVKETSGSGVPTGTVTFLDGTTTLGTGTLNGAGTATYNAGALAAGTHTLTANYGGDASNASSTSSAITVTINAAPAPATFTFGLSPATGTVTSGNSINTTATVTPSGGFNQAVTFACSGLPANASCAFSPASVTPNGSAATTTVTIATGVQAALAQPATGRGRSALAFLLGGLAALLVGLGGRPGRGRKYFLALFIVLAGLLAGILSSCGSGGGSNGSSGSGGSGGSSTPSGPSTVTITATGGSVTQSATFTLTVQ
jgi:hypothetical protein